MGLNLKIRTQIMLFFTLIAILVSALMILVYLLNVTYLNSMLTEQSLKIISIENRIQLNQQLQGYGQRFDSILQIYQRKHRILNRMYNFVESNDISVAPVTYCPPNISIQNSQLMFCMMAFNYTVDNYTLAKPLVPFQFKFIPMMHEAILIFDATSMFATGIAYTGDELLPMLGTWPALNQSISYNAYQRSWYKNHQKYMKSGEDYYFSDLFTTIINSYTVAMTSNLTKISGQYGGVILNLMDFNVFKENFNKNYILVNAQGQIILSYFQYPQNSTKPVYIFNETTTGFDNIDWLEIQQHSDYGNGTSNCNREIVQGEFICRYNTVFEQDSLMVVKRFTTPPYIMILFKNITEIYDSINQLHTNVESKLEQEQFQLFYVFGITLICCYIGFIVILKQITKPIELLIQHSLCKTYNSINTNTELDQKFKKLEHRDGDTWMDYSDTTIGELKRSYRHLFFDSLSKQQKCDLCKQMERIPYAVVTKRLRNLHLEQLQDAN